MIMLLCYDARFALHWSDLSDIAGIYFWTDIIWCPIFVGFISGRTLFGSGNELKLVWFLVKCLLWLVKWLVETWRDGQVVCFSFFVRALL